MSRLRFMVIKQGLLMSNDISRFAMPTKLDHAPYGTRCKVEIDAGKYHLYIQLSDDEENPKWEHMGIFHSIETGLTETPCSGN